MAVFSGNGSLAAPSFTFSSDNDLGLYRIGANALGVTCGNDISASFGPAGINVGSTNTANGPAFEVNGGSLSTTNTTFGVSTNLTTGRLLTGGSTPSGPFISSVHSYVDAVGMEISAGSTSVKSGIAMTGTFSASNIGSSAVSVFTAGTEASRAKLYTGSVPTTHIGNDLDGQPGGVAYYPALAASISSNTAAAATFANGGGSAPAVVHIIDDFASSNHTGLFVGKEDFSALALRTRDRYVNTSYNIGSGQGFNINDSAVYNDGLAHGFNGYGAAAFFIHILTTLAGNTTIPVFSNAGAGVAYAWTILDPDAGTWQYITSTTTLNFVAPGGGTNTYSVQFSSNSGTITVTRNAGSSSYRFSTQPIAI